VNQWQWLAVCGKIMETQKHMRKTRIVSVSICGALCALPAASLAQGVQIKPATTEELNTYTGMGAVSICSLNQSGVSFDKSLQSSIQMFLSVMDGRHGGAIQGVDGGKKLPEKVLMNGGLVETIVKVDGICGKDFVGDNKRRLDNIKEEIEKAASNKSTSSPATK